MDRGGPPPLGGLASAYRGTSQTDSLQGLEVTAAWSGALGPGLPRPSTGTASRKRKPRPEGRLRTGSPQSPPVPNQHHTVPSLRHLRDTAPKGWSPVGFALGLHRGVPVSCLLPGESTGRRDSGAPHPMRPWPGLQPSVPQPCQARGLCVRGPLPWSRWPCCRGPAWPLRRLVHAGVRPAGPRPCSFPAGNLAQPRGSPADMEACSGKFREGGTRVRLGMGAPQDRRPRQGRVFARLCCPSNAKLPAACRRPLSWPHSDWSCLRSWHHGLG